MGINRVRKRGKSRIEVRKRWPDGTTFRRYFPNMTLARRIRTEIEASILNGSWLELQERLSRSQLSEQVTIRELSQQFLEEVRPRLSPTTHYRYAHSFQFINRDLGAKPYLRLDRAALHGWLNKRAGEVSPSTANRDLTALKRMYRWAYETGLTERHLLSGVRPFKEPLVERRLLSFEEYEDLIEASGMVVNADALALKTFVIVLGETGCRKSEGLHLRVEEVDFTWKTVTFNKTKGSRSRVVPLSARLRDCLAGMDAGREFVLVNPRTDARLTDPKKGFSTAAKLAGVPWLQIHDLRRFRACQWAKGGIPVPTIQKLLGHRSLETTTRYLMHIDVSFEAVRRVSQKELDRGRQLGDRAENGVVSTTKNREK